MTHVKRSVSSTGFYHVTMRGNAKGIIFENDAHRSKMLNILTRYRDELGFRIIAWCLMDNHVHLVLDAWDIDLSSAIHRIALSYAAFFNKSEHRVGHLFQGPFRSVPIEYEEQLVNTVRYIHLNPERAGICPGSHYRWSSYAEYAQGPWIVDTDPVLSICGGREGFLAGELEMQYVVRVPRPKRVMTDAEAIAITNEELGERSLEKLRSGDRKFRDAAIVRLRGRGLTVSQLARLCSIGERSVSRIISLAKREAASIQGTQLRRET